jgi:acyl-CoA thioester hydrolase
MTKTTEIAVRFSDIDAMGHVNNAVFLNYFEQARIDFFNSLIGVDWNWKDQGIVLARNEIDYMRPILLSDKVLIDTRIEHIGSKSMTFSYIVHSGDPKERQGVFAKGKSIIVAFDYKKGVTREIPDSWRSAFQAS